MEIQVHTDHTIHGHEAFLSQIKQEVQDAMGHLAEHLTRVDVHLSDETGPKISANAFKCLIEARIKKHQPVSVRVHAETANEAVRDALRKLVGLIDAVRGRIQDKKRQPEQTIH